MNWLVSICRLSRNVVHNFVICTFNTVNILLPNSHFISVTKTNCAVWSHLLQEKPCLLHDNISCVCVRVCRAGQGGLGLSQLDCEHLSMHTAASEVTSHSYNTHIQTYASVTIQYTSTQHPALDKIQSAVGAWMWHMVAISSVWKIRPRANKMCYSLYFHLWLT